MIFLIIPLLIALSFVLTTFIGYWIHRAFHKDWAGLFYRAHLDHHAKQYPASNFTSDVYRSSGGNDSRWYFIIVFLPLLIAIAMGSYLISLPFWYPLTIICTMLAVGHFHEVVHESFHLNTTRWSKLPFYQEWKDLHWNHHKWVQKNFGIFSYKLDKLFGTYKDSKKT